MLYQEKKKKESPEKKVRSIFFPTLDDYRNREREKERKRSFFCEQVNSRLLFKTYSGRNIYIPTRFAPTNTLSFIEILFFFFFYSHNQL
jgi:hypothetical protein